MLKGGIGPSVLVTSASVGTSTHIHTYTHTLAEKEGHSFLSILAETQEAAGLVRVTTNVSMSSSVCGHRPKGPPSLWASAPCPAHLRFFQRVSQLTLGGKPQTMLSAFIGI